MRCCTLTHAAQEVEWWVYTVCPNVRVTQTHNALNDTPMEHFELGSHLERIVQMGQNRFAVEYTGGSLCRMNIARSVRVEFFCDDLGGRESKNSSAAPALIDVSEPQRCVYVARVHFPALCAAEPRKQIVCKVEKTAMQDATVSQEAMW